MNNTAQTLAVERWGDLVWRLADAYYASSYQGTMGSEVLNQALRDWLNEQTGGLLEDYANGVELDANTLLALATTIYYKEVWAEKFPESLTDSQIFHGAGGDVTVDFMNQQSTGAYYWGGQFSAVSKSFKTDGIMWLVLPDEGVSVDDLLADDEITEFLTSGSQWETSPDPTSSKAPETP